MLEIGAAFLLFWLLINPLNVAVDVAVLIVGIVFIVLSFLLGNTIATRRP